MSSEETLSGRKEGEVALGKNETESAESKGGTDPKKTQICQLAREGKAAYGARPHHPGDS